MSDNCKRPQKPILGQEAICPRGLGRVTDFKTDDEGVGPYIEVRTYVNDGSRRYRPENVTLVPIFPEHVCEQSQFKQPITDSEIPRVGYQVVGRYGEGVVTSIDSQTNKLYIKLHRTGRTVLCELADIRNIDFSTDLYPGMRVAVHDGPTGEVVDVSAQVVKVLPDGKEDKPYNYEYFNPDRVRLSV